MSDRRRNRDHSQAIGEDSVELSESDESEPEEQPSGAPFDPDLDDSGDDGEAEVCALAPTAQSTFALSGGGSAFSYRSRSIFDCLDSVERQNAPALSQGSAAATGSRKTTRPPPTCSTPPPPKKRGVPDYLVHPERWTRYSLEDVAESSDRDNRRAAHQFLSGLRQETKTDPACDIQQRMIFSKPKRPLKEQVAAQESQQGKEKNLQLSHLEGDEEEGKERKEPGGEIVEKNKEEDESGAVGAEEEKKKEESGQSFTSFRKTKLKNYRRSSGQEAE